MVLGARGNWSFILVFRGTKLVALVTVAIAIAVATVVFQTITANRILTPAVMGFDALYILIQASLVFAFGGLGYAMLGAELKFAIDLVVLSAAALGLFGTLLGRGVQDLFRMLLVGVVFGVLFRSLTNLLSRLNDPSEFAVFQGSLFASFNRIDTSLLIVTVPLVAVLCGIIWKKRTVLDVMALGRETATGLGVCYQREVVTGLALVAGLVAVSTALVGVVSFFGLLVSALSYEFIKTHRHGPIFVSASLISIIVLVGGQAVFERVLGMAATLGIVIEFLGGLVFLLLILKKVRT
ncbi:iron ABC transporter permease [Roseibium sp. RKSG952]|nr:iron ABC transporter permease [Roseibium sp. RKSG952]